MSTRECTKEKFLENVKDHKLTVNLDNGLYRNLLFKKPGTINQQFDITTWPGYLCISGDMGTFVFKRVEDMFKFFRMDDGELGINPGYWSEKVESQSRFGGGITEWSQDAFEENVKERLNDWLECAKDDELDPEFIEEQREKVNDMLEYHCDDEWSSVMAIREWHDDDDGVSFDDFFECSCNRATYHYIWCCYAIAWAVIKYDQHKASEALIQQPGQ